MVFEKISIARKVGFSDALAADACYVVAKACHDFPLGKKNFFFQKAYRRGYQEAQMLKHEINSQKKDNG